MKGKCVRQLLLELLVSDAEQSFHCFPITTDKTLITKELAALIFPF